MGKHFVVCLPPLIWITVCAGGCLPTMAIDALKTMRPRRPPQLEQLNVFVGKWEWEGEGTVAGLDQPVRFSGTRESQWDGDGWFLVTREVGNMEGVGESRTLIVWSYDTRARKFRTTYVDTKGTSMVGTTWCNEKTKVWHYRATSRGPAGTASAKGHMRFPDPDTMEWDWSEYAIGGLKRTMELTGVCRRKR